MPLSIVRFLSIIIAHPKLVAFGICLAITFAIGIAIGLANHSHIIEAFANSQQLDNNEPTVIIGIIIVIKRQNHVRCSISSKISHLRNRIGNNICNRYSNRMTDQEEYGTIAGNNNLLLIK